MEAILNPLDNTASMALAAGQKWDKPFGVLPVTFDKLAATADPGFKTVTVTAAGQMDLLVKSPLDMTIALEKGAAPRMNLKLTPGADFIKLILDRTNVPAPLKPLVNQAAPGAVVHEVEVIGDYAKMKNKSKPDVRLNFTMKKSGWSKTFNILVSEVDLGKPDEFAEKAGAKIIEQLTADAVGGALEALGIKFKWTLVDLDFKVVKMKIDAEGDPKDKYSLDGKFNLPLAGNFEMKGAWYPAKPFDPIVFEANNIFKPIVEQLIGDAIPKDQFELKDKMFVTLTLSGEAVAALQSGGGGGGSAPAPTSGDKSGGAPFKLDIGFPMKLQIDPTKPAFDMTGRVYPFEQTATLELDQGVVWKEPFGIIPATFNKLVAGTDPSFTTLTINAQGKSDFLGDMEFEIDALMRKGEKPTLKFQVKPSGDMVAAIMKKVKIPAGMPMPEVKLEKFNVLADFAQMAAGQLPSAAVKFSVSTPLTGKVDVDIDIPSINFKQPDRFAATVAKELTKNLSRMVTDIGPQVIANAAGTVKNAATDPVGTAKSAADAGKAAATGIGNAAVDFAKDPAGGAKDLASAAANLGKAIGESAYNTVKDEVNKWASDPAGQASAQAKAALEKAEAALNAVSGFLSDIGGAITDIFSQKSAKEMRGEREIEALKKLGEDTKKAKTVADVSAIFDKIKANSDLCWDVDDVKGTMTCGHRTAEFRNILLEMWDAFEKVEAEAEKNAEAERKRKAEAERAAKERDRIAYYREKLQKLSASSELPKLIEEDVRKNWYMYDANSGYFPATKIFMTEVSAAAQFIAGYNKANKLEDYLALLDALEGKPTGSYPNLSVVAAGKYYPAEVKSLKSHVEQFVKIRDGLDAFLEAGKTSSR